MERVGKVGTSLSFTAECSYDFSAIAKKKLCNKTKTVNEAVNTIEAKTCFSDSCCCLQRRCNVKVSLGFSFIYFCGKMCIKKYSFFFFDSEFAAILTNALS